jgi:hypothetical protein
MSQDPSQILAEVERAIPIVQTWARAIDRPEQEKSAVERLLAFALVKLNEEQHYRSRRRSGSACGELASAVRQYLKALDSFKVRHKGQPVIGGPGQGDVRSALRRYEREAKSHD